MTAVVRITIAILLWTVAFVGADLQAPDTDRARRDVTVDAVVTGPGPGEEEATQAARVTNPLPVPVQLRAEAAVVRAAGARCPSALVAHVAPARRAQVPAGGTAAVEVEIRTTTRAPASCRAATWPVELPATALPPLTGTSEPEGGPPLAVYAAVALGLGLLVGGLLLVGGRRARPPTPAPRPTGDTRPAPAPRPRDRAGR